MRKLHLDKLKEGLPGISPAYGAFLAEAAAVCLVTMGHHSGVRLSVKGDFEEDFLVEWAKETGVTEKMTWGDVRELVEYSAMAMALLLLPELTEYCQFQKKEQGDSYDYLIWKIENDNNEYPASNESAALEVSGIMKETPGNTLDMRISMKKKQVSKLPGNMTAFIVVLEFSVPKAKIVIQ